MVYSQGHTRGSTCCLIEESFTINVARYQICRIVASSFVRNGIPPLAQPGMILSQGRASGVQFGYFPVEDKFIDAEYNGEDDQGPGLNEVRGHEVADGLTQNRQGEAQHHSS